MRARNAKPVVIAGGGIGGLACDALGVGERVSQEALFIERLLMMDAVSGETVIDIPLGKRFS